MRVVRGRDSYWCLRGAKIAQLPLEAAEPDETGEWRLVDEAMTALESGGFFQSKPTDVYSVTVLTNTGCNLGCGYCFQNIEIADESNYAPDRIPLRALTEPVIGDILTFTEGMMRRAELSRLKLLLFGGEPLMSADACVELLARAQDIGMVSASMVSNGTLLTAALAKELANAGLRAIQITFDGDRDTHDRIRVTRNGRGTFDRILANVAEASAATELHWQFRINVSHRNSGGVRELLDRLAARTDTARAGVDIAMIDDIGIGYDNRLRHGEELAREYISWYVHALDLGFALRPPRAGFWCEFCSLKAGERGAVINADGTLYSCWETVGKPGLDVGDIWRGYLPAERLDPRWHHCDYLAAEHGDPRQTRRFHDTVDAAILDELAARGRLN